MSLKALLLNKDFSQLDIFQVENFILIPEVCAELKYGSWSISKVVVDTMLLEKQKKQLKLFD